MGNEPFITPELQRCLNGKTIIGLNGSAFTKGGAAKRVFKPTIPTTRRSVRGTVAGINSGAEARDQNNSCNGKMTNGKVKGKEKSNKAKGKKELIQLDATFNGINITSSALKVEKAFISPGGSGYGQSNDTRTLRSSQSDSLRGIGSTSSVNGCIVKSENNEPSYGNNIKSVNSADHHEEQVEESVESIQRVLYRDDFVPPFDPNEEDMTPIGWNHVSQHQVFKQEDKIKRDIKPSLRRFDNWASTKKDQDKMVLFQLPEMLLNSNEGHVGKIRMYQSGKMELVDTRSGLVYDLIHTDCDVNPHPGGGDDDDEDEDEDENSDDDTTSEDNDEESREDGQEEAAAAASASGESKFSTDWIKKEVEDDNPRNYDFLPPPPIPSQPSTSKSYLSSTSVQSPTHSASTSTHKLSKLSSKSKSTSKSTSKSSSKNVKANHHNRRNKCDKDEDKDYGNDDDDQEDDDDDDFNRNINQSYREACTFDGEQVVCLGPISNNQLLIGRPRLDKFINL